MQMPYRKNQTGFTLIEIMAALGIVAVGIGAISQLIVQNVRTTARIEERVLANWVAANAMANYRLNSRVELSLTGTANTTGGEADGDSGGSSASEMGGREWVVNETITPTEVEGTVRVDVEVFPAEGSDTPAAVLSSIVAKRL